MNTVFKTLPNCNFVTLGIAENSYTSSPSIQSPSNYSDWSWPFGTRNFDDTDTYDWSAKEGYLHHSGRRKSRLKAARKAEKKRKVAARVQRNFIRRYGKLVSQPQ